jgi:molybdenum cofactor cytidylyltransferase
VPADAERSVAGVVLAAGASTRFGRNKLLLSVSGDSLARRAAKAALEGGLDPVVVVLGHEADRIGQELSGLRVRAIVNPDYARGMNTSLRAGVEAVPDDVSALVVLLADMPLVTGDMIARLVEAYRQTGAPLVASDYDGVHAPPTLYSRPLFAELGGPEGDGSGKRVVKRHADEAVRVSWPSDRLADVDREEDWERIRAAMS